MILQLGIPMKTQDLLIEAAEKDNMSVETYVEKLLILCLDSEHDFNKWHEKEMKKKQLLNGRAPELTTDNRLRTLNVEEEYHKVESAFSLNQEQIMGKPTNDDRMSIWLNSAENFDRALDKALKDYEDAVDKFRAAGGIKMSWDMIRVEYGDQQKYLDDGWEPFAVTSDQHQVEKGRQFDTVFSYTVYVYLRRQVKE